MRKSRAKKQPEFVFKGGKPTGVILDINEYKEMLEKLNDVSDLKLLDRMRTRSLQFKKLDDFLREYHPGV